MRDSGKFFSAILILLMFSFLSKAQADERLWAALRSGTAVAMIRHAVAPGHRGGCARGAPPARDRGRDPL